MRHKRAVVMMALVLMSALTMLSAEALDDVVNGTSCHGTFPIDDENIKLTSGGVTPVTGTRSVSCDLPNTHGYLNPISFTAVFRDHNSSADIQVRLHFLTVGDTFYYSPTYLLTPPPVGEVYHCPPSPNVCVWNFGFYYGGTGLVINDGEPFNVISVNAVWRLHQDTVLIRQELQSTKD